MRFSSLAEMPTSLREKVEAALQREGTKAPKRKAQSDKAGMFLAYWNMDPSTRGLPFPVAEYRFGSPRRWRFDWAWPEALIAVEVDGGRWAPGGGKHASDEDREKLNSAAARGWRVFRVAPSQLKREAPAFVAMVAGAVREASR